VWGKSFWAKGYFAETVGSLNYSNVKKDIQNQRQEYATDSTSSSD
jgi:REP element-mobilizing transposase RayT